MDMRMLTHRSGTLSFRVPRSFLAPTLLPLQPVFPSCGQMCLQSPQGPLTPHNAHSFPSPASNPEARGFVHASTLRSVRSCWLGSCVRSPPPPPHNCILFAWPPLRRGSSRLRATAPHARPVNYVTLLCFLLYNNPTMQCFHII